MAPAQSKHLICSIGIPHELNQDLEYVNDFNTKNLDDVSDHHCWCEDEFGKIYDPTNINFLDMESEMGKMKKNRHYMKWDNQKEELEKVQEKMWHTMFRVIRTDKNNQKDEWDKLLNGDYTDNEENRIKILDDFYKNGQINTALQCTLNSSVMANQFPQLKVVIGSFGWKKKKEWIKFKKKKKKGEKKKKWVEVDVIIRPVIDIWWGQ